jgi:uncharacterized membrane protein
MLSKTAGHVPPSPEPAAGMIPDVVPPLPRESRFARHLPASAPLGWLKAGWRDFRTAPLPSLAYGLAVAALSVLIVWALIRLRLDYVIFPALAGFMVLGPLVAQGLYEKSRRLASGEAVGLMRMILIRPRAGYQAVFMGVLLLGLFLLWLRAAVLLYALFFGLRPFPGGAELISVLMFTPTGWALLVTGSLVGALFAGFAFAISVFAAPMLLSERIDALSAMGISMAAVWANLAVMLIWGAIVVALVVLALATAGLGLVVVFPVLGHATWHAYRQVAPLPRGKAV